MTQRTRLTENDQLSAFDVHEGLGDIGVRCMALIIAHVSNGNILNAQCAVSKQHKTFQGSFFEVSAIHIAGYATPSPDANIYLPCLQNHNTGAQVCNKGHTFKVKLFNLLQLFGKTRVRAPIDSESKQCHFEWQSILWVAVSRISVSILAKSRHLIMRSKTMLRTAAAAAAAIAVMMDNDAGCRLSCHGMIKISAK